MELLARNAGRIVSRHEILSNVWGPAAKSAKTRSTLSSLAPQKVDDGAELKLIHTHRGFGYSLGSVTPRMSFTIRARLTALYFLVLAASFTGFFWICDYGFQKSISTAVNDASQRNLDTLEALLERHLSQGTPQLSQELTRVSDLWESGAIFQVAGPDGRGSIVP